MALSAVDKARTRWGMDQQTPVVIDGSGDGQEYEDARKTVRGLMPQLVGLDGVVRKTTLAELNSLMISFGLEKVDEKDSPKEQLFYQRGRLLIRIKPRGNRPGAKYREGQPHLSVCLMKDGVDTGSPPS
jgi:hypothetical protein